MTWIPCQRLAPLARVLRGSVLAALVAAMAVGLARPSHTATALPKTLRIWYGSDDPAEQSWVKQVVQRFGARYPTVQVTLSFYDLDDLIEKAQLALSSGAAPDLLYTTPRGPGLPAYVHAGKLRDLSADVKKRGWAARLRPGLLAAYNQLLAANGTARDRGHVYAVPYLMAAVGVLYNKDIFRKLHLQLPRTTAQFAALLPRLKTAGYTPIGFGNEDAWVGDAWYLTLLNAQVGPQALRPALRLDPAFRFTAPPFRQAAATLQGWARAGYFSRNFGSLDPQEAVEDFFERGHTAMQLVSSTQNAHILTELGDTDSKATNVGLFAFPSARGGQPPVMVQDGYSGWAIPTAAHNPAAALDFIDQATSEDTTRILLAHGLLPAHRLDNRSMQPMAPFQRDYLSALAVAPPGVYVDAAPIPNFLATMEAHLQLLLKGRETPHTLTQRLQDVYASRGRTATFTRTDGEF
jgi:raffinose/stachyose/melibiose transport system substrate-binding protein